MAEEGAAAALRFHHSLQHPVLTKTPVKADVLLAHALNGLSMLDRERVWEEIHGINCGPSKKNHHNAYPDDLESSSGDTSVSSFQSIEGQCKHEEDEALCKLQEEVDTLMAAASPTIVESPAPGGAPAQSLHPAYRYALAHGSPLLTDRQFQLSFLRNEGYNQPRKAAVRFLKHLDTLQEVFDTTAVLFRPLQLADLESDTIDNHHPTTPANTTTKNTATNKRTSTGMTKQRTDGTGMEEETRSTTPMLMPVPSMLDDGFLQVLPVRDTSGRRILCRFREPPISTSMKAWQRFLFYISQTVADDPNGCILIVFLHNNSARMRTPDAIRGISKVFQTHRLRFNAIHACCPTGPVYEAVKAMYTLIFQKEDRSRIRFHTGSYQECTYSLKSFGIPVERLPPNGFGMKSEVIVQRENSNHRKWIAMQKALETEIAEHVATKQQSQHHPLMSLNSSAMAIEAHNTLTAYNTVRAKYVECAYHEDCLFGKGRSAMKHPGNIGMRRLLEEKYNLYNYDLYPDQHLKAKIAMEIVEEIKHGSGRFLKEVETDQGSTTIKTAMTGSGLLVAVNDKMALQKFKIALRDLRKRKQIIVQDRAAEQRKLRKTGTKNKITATGPTAVSHRRLKKLTASLVESSFTTSIENFAQLNTTLLLMEDDTSVGTIDGNNEDGEYLPLPLDCQGPLLTFSCCDASAMAVAVDDNNDATVLPPHCSLHVDMYNFTDYIEEKGDRQRRQNKAQKLHGWGSPNTADDDDDDGIFEHI